MNSIFYDVLKLKTVSKYKKYFDQHFYEACFETLRLWTILKHLTKLYKPRAL